MNFAPQKALTAQSKHPFYEMTIGDLQASVFEEDDGKFSLTWKICEDGAELVGATLSDLDTGGYVDFFQRLFPREVHSASAVNLLQLKPERADNENTEETFASPTLEAAPFCCTCEEGFSITPEQLRDALHFAVDNGAKINRSIDRLVKSFEYIRGQQSVVKDPEVTLYEINRESGTHRLRKNPRRIGSKKETALQWFDIDAPIPYKAMNEGTVIELAQRYLPPNTLEKDYKFLSLRGFSFDPAAPDKAIRRKLLVLVGEKSLITIHDGQVDNIGVHGAQDSLTTFKGILSGARSTEDFFVTTEEQRKKMGPGALLLDLCSCLFLNTELTMKRQHQVLDDAKYDAEHGTSKHAAFTVDIESMRDATAYVDRKIKELLPKLETFCASRGQSFRKIFGTIEPGEIKSAEEALMNSGARTLTFCESATTKIEFLKSHKDAIMAEERERRSYGLTVLGTLIIPQLAAVELAQVPMGLISQNPDKILMGGGIGSICFTAGFMLYDRWRKKKIGA